MATFRLKEWFFTITETASKRGTRLRDGDRPTQSTFEDLLKSIVFKSEIADKAKINDNNKPSQELVGHVVLATGEDNINDVPQPVNKSLVLQPGQTTIFEDSDNTEEIDVVLPVISNTYEVTNNPVVGKLVQVETQSSTERRSYLISATSAITSLSNIIQDSLSSVMNRLVSLNGRVTTNSESISTLIENNDDFTTLINSLQPIGTTIFSMVPILAPDEDPRKAVWAPLDGNSSNTYPRYEIDGVTETTGYTILQNLGIFNSDGSEYYFNDASNCYATQGASNLRGTLSNQQLSAPYAELTEDNLPRHKHSIVDAPSIYDINEKVLISGGAHVHVIDGEYIGITGIDAGANPVYAPKSGDENGDRAPDKNLVPSQYIKTNGGLGQGEHGHNLRGSTKYAGSSSSTSRVNVTMPKLNGSWYIKIK